MALTGLLAVGPLAAGAATASVSSDTSQSASPAFSSGEVRGYAARCADDAADSSALRNKIQIWDCLSDASQQWSLSGGELKHGSLCMNDKASGGNGSHVILWTCNGAGNETWNYNDDGEYVLRANGLCLDDPASSTRNGTQLIVYSCHDSANQHWSLPGANCYPISNEGTCYEPGEYCRTDDHGVTGLAGDGKTIICEDWRWEPVR
jgi:hypothetical protein